nr:hypothetical protein [Tanacetum cinerariifolium]
WYLRESDNLRDLESGKSRGLVTLDSGALLRGTQVQGNLLDFRSSAQRYTSSGKLIGFQLVQRVRIRGSRTRGFDDLWLLSRESLTLVIRR